MVPWDEPGLPSSLGIGRALAADVLGRQSKSIHHRPLGHAGFLHFGLPSHPG